MSHRTLKISLNVTQNPKNFPLYRTELSIPSFLLKIIVKTSFHIALNSQNLILNRTECSTTPKNIAVTVLTSVICVIMAHTLVSGYQVRKNPAASIKLKLG